MGFFKKIFGQKTQTPEPDSRLEQQFDAEWLAAIRRYGILTGVGNINIVLKHPQTQEIMAPHAGLNQTFREWQEQPTFHARRMFLFSEIVKSGGGISTVWHAANYLVATGEGERALEALEEEAPPEEGAGDYAPHCDSYARAYLAMTMPEKAIEWARRAVAVEPEEPRFQIDLADALHLSGDGEEAHTIYERMMATAPASQAGPEDAIQEMFANMFSQETGVLPSPVMAFQFGQALSDPQQWTEFWTLAEDEFYDSPYFRLMHAYHLAEQGDRERFFAKLAGLVIDMPWVKEANLNLIGYIEQIDPTGKNILPELQAEVRERIQANGWNDKGMHVREIPM